MSERSFFCGGVFLYFFISFVSWGLGHCSLRSIDNIAHGLAFMSYSVFRMRRKLILKNLRIAFANEKSQKELTRIGYLSVYNFILTCLEFLAARDGSVGKHVEIIEGENFLQEALAAGKGAYILCLHMGSWEAMGGALTRLGYRSNVVVKKVGSEKVNQFVIDLREKNGFYSILKRKKGDGKKGINNALKKNELVGFVMDQARPGEPLLPFFSKPAKTNTSFAAIWKQNPAPILPIYILRQEAGRHSIKVKPILKLPVSGDEKEDIMQHSIIFNKIMENIIRDCPEQYLWMHNRWKV